MSFMWMYLFLRDPTRVLLKFNSDEIIKKIERRRRSWNERFIQASMCWKMRSFNFRRVQPHSQLHLLLVESTCNFVI